MKQWLLKMWNTKIHYTTMEDIIVIPMILILGILWTCFGSR